MIVLGLVVLLVIVAARARKRRSREHTTAPVVVHTLLTDATPRLAHRRRGRQGNL